MPTRERHEDVEAIRQADVQDSKRYAAGAALH